MKKILMSLALVVLSGCASTDIQFVSAGSPDFVPKTETIKVQAKALAGSFDRPVEMYFNMAKKTQLALGVAPVGTKDKPGCMLVYQKELWERAMPRLGFKSSPDNLLKLFVAHEITHCYVHHNSKVKTAGLQAEMLADAGALLYAAINDPLHFDGLASDLEKLRRARQNIDSGKYPTPSNIQAMAARAKTLASALPPGSPISIELIDKVHPFLLKSL